jgi:hypothetical protein
VKPVELGPSETADDSQVDVVARDVISAWAGIAADAESVYVAGAEGMLRRLSVDGSTEMAIAELGGERVSQIRVQGAYAYWLTESGRPFSGRPFASAIHRARTVLGAAAETLWESDHVAVGLALGAGYLFVDEYNDGAEQPNGALLRIAASDGSVVPLASDLFFPSVVAADNQFVYFTAQSRDERNTQLWRIAVDGDKAELLYAGGPLEIIDGQMLLSSGFIWFPVSAQGDGRLVKVPTGGGEAIIVATMTNTPSTRGLAADAQHFFFSGSWSWDAIGPGAIWSLAR